MNDFIPIIITVLSSVLASSGLWTLILRKMDNKTETTRLLIGLAHDRIMMLCGHYIERGYITKDEYEDLNEYLFIPYTNLGGNGSAKRMMDEVNKLPIKGNSILMENKNEE